MPFVVSSGSQFLYKCLGVRSLMFTEIYYLTVLVFVCLECILKLYVMQEYNLMIWFRTLSNCLCVPEILVEIFCSSLLLLGNHLILLK